jgi:hypothetical protein
MKRWFPLVRVPGTHQQSFAGRSLMSRLSAPTPDWFSWKHANAGAVTTDFKQCETDRIFLGAEYATDETFLPAPPNNLACSRRSRNGAGSIPAATRNSTCYPAYLLFRCSLRAGQIHPLIIIEFRDVFRCSGINSPYRRDKLQSPIRDPDHSPGAPTKDSTAIAGIGSRNSWYFRWWRFRLLTPRDRAPTRARSGLSGRQ